MRHEIKELIDKHYSRLNQELGFSNVKNRSEGERPTLAKRSSVQAVAASVSSPYQQLNLQGKSATVVVDDLIESASKLGASDIHVQPGEHELSVRFRLDGLLQTVATLPKEQFPAIVSRIKILAQMDVAERTDPAGWTFYGETTRFDFRSSHLYPARSVRREGCYSAPDQERGTAQPGQFENGSRIATAISGGH